MQFLWDVEPFTKKHLNLQTQSLKENQEYDAQNMKE